MQLVDLKPLQSRIFESSWYVEQSFSFCKLHGVFVFGFIRILGNFDKFIALG